MPRGWVGRSAMFCSYIIRLPLLLGLGLTVSLWGGCGSVGEVGYGASRAGVEPVGRSSGYTTTPYGMLNPSQQAERVRTLAGPNQRTHKISTLLKKAKGLPDEEGVEVGQVDVPVQPTLDAQIKLLVAQHEQQPPATERVALGPDADAFGE